MRNFVIAAAMAAMVCMIGCDRLSITGPQGIKGEKGDKGDPGLGMAEIGDDCKSDAECGNAGKCGMAKFCRSADSDELTATVRKRREVDVMEAEEVLRKAGEALTVANKICANPSGDCKVADEAERHVKSAEKQIEQAKDQLALVTPAPEPPKPEATAKADEKKDEKKDEKPATDKPAVKKPAAAKPSASAKTGTSIKDVVNGLALRVTDAEGRLDDMEGGQQTLQTKMGQVVASLGELNKNVEAAPVPDVEKPTGGTINKPRLDRCVSGRLKDPFFGEELDDADRQIKADEFCLSKQQAG